MKDKLIKIISEYMNLESMFVGATEKFAEYLIANNVFVLPEKMKDSWELALPFMMRLFVADEEEIEKIKGEFELQKVKQILTDIRDYLVTEKSRVANSDIYLLQIQEVKKFADKALAYLADYAKKLGVEL